ncbi:MAG: hypothetical protein IPK50_21940 [Fibrobacterota bacterium]|nr:hypothetical protein [Fibrobacterota bacterium]QQS04908.1 MAG: hypothetical protein IPK50_21940 [Fibrobacterota bacterium]
MNSSLWALLALVSQIAGAAIVDVLPADPSIRLLGRYGKDSYSPDIQWAWSASGAAITFSGTSCSIRMQAQSAIYSVLVDGKETKVLDLSKTPNDTLFSLATGLPQGTHTVAVRLRTEAQHSLTRFRGFRIDGTPGTPPAESDRRIEFYGNSITCGYGILDSVASHPFSVQTENEALTYAALAADSVGAQRHTICWSGRGVVQNYGGDTKSATVPRMYKQVLTWDTTVVWDFSRWVPQVVVIDLGTNDYSTASAQPDSAKFFRTYRDFVDTLHARYPLARFVLVDGPMMSDNYPSGLKTLTKIRSHLDNVVADVTKRGIKATHLSLTPQEDSRGYGADYHPNRAQARLNGAELAAHLRQILPEWDKSSARSAPLSLRPNLVRLPAGLAIHNPSQVPWNAKIVDLRGRRSWNQVVPASATMILPATKSVQWLVLESAEGSQVRTLQPDLR